MFVEALEKKIMASAQRSRASYLDTASAVAKMASNAGAAFDHDNNQVIAFMEQVNKQFVIGEHLQRNKNMRWSSLHRQWHPGRCGGKN